MKNFAIYFVNFYDPQRCSERIVISAITRDKARHEFFKQFDGEQNEITEIIELPY